ncbi:MAG TPA: ATP-binding cassette domain-containing protein [Kofleriaceae bacterium]|nr:ATP-binding cassette domain-containing protein [Kofleriaceae bacterium]
MSALAVRAAHLAFAHGDAVPLFEDVSLHLGPGWWGLVGENGAGKSTLLRLLAGELEPAGGSLTVEPTWARVALCEQAVDLPPAGGAELAGSRSGEAIRLRARLRLEPADLARWDTLSPGERKRWQIGAALLGAPDLLLCDEPTNHLDADGRALLVAALRRHRGIGVVVSHDRALLDELTCATLRVQGTRVDAVPAPYSRARQIWAGEAAAAASAREAAQERVAAARRRASAARRDQAGATRMRSSRARMKDAADHDGRTMAAKNLAEWAEAGAGRRVAVQLAAVARAEAALSSLPPAERRRGRSIHLEWVPPPRPVLLELAADQLRAGPRVLARDLRVALGRGDRVHLRGANGAGKSALIAALLARSTLPPDRVLHLAQELPPDAGTHEVSRLRERPPAERGRALSLLAALGADPDRVLASPLPSPGETRKLAIADALARQAWLLVLDEPTNHLDLPSIERLEAALADYPGALLLVSHDDAFARPLVDRAWRLDAGQLVEEAA